MKKSTVNGAPDHDALLDLGKVLGQGLAFGTIAGRCSGARAAAIRQARQDKIHTRIGLKWNEFCPKHLKMSGTQADEIVRLYEEFGPDYFEHTQSVRISAGTYRLVAPFIRDRALHSGDSVLELNSANVQKVARSLRESRKALPAPAPPSLPDRLNALDPRIRELLAELREVAKSARQPETSPVVLSMFQGTLIRLTCEVRRVSLENGVVV